MQAGQHFSVLLRIVLTLRGLVKYGQSGLPLPHHVKLTAFEAHRN